MSLSTHYYEKAKREQSAAADVDAGVYHATAEIWMVGHTRDGVLATDRLIFNPKTNLNGAAGYVMPQLMNIALVNTVYVTKVKLCSLPCELMMYRPNWRVLRLEGHKLCERCAHNIEHQIERFQALPDDAREMLRNEWEARWPHCKLDERGIMVLR